MYVKVLQVLESTAALSWVDMEDNHAILRTHSAKTAMVNHCMGLPCNPSPTPGHPPRQPMIHSIHSLTACCIYKYVWVWVVWVLE